MIECMLQAKYNNINPGIFVLIKLIQILTFGCWIGTFLEMSLCQ